MDLLYLIVVLNILCSCLQEREFLKNYVQRIVDVRPNLVLVEKTVSRIAQDMLLEHGITLVINVKPVSVSCQSETGSCGRSLCFLQEACYKEKLEISYF